MSVQALDLASQVAMLDDGSPAETLAHALLDKQRDYEWMAAQYLELNRKHNALSHEVERLRERRGEVATKEPVMFYCLGSHHRCTSKLELQPLHDTDVPVLVRLAGWGVNEKGERLCKRCKEQP